MGVSICIWRVRIGLFTGCRSSKKKNDVNVKRPFISLSMHSSFLSVFALTYLLLIGNIEPHPGPTIEELILQSQTTLTNLINTTKSDTLDAVNASINTSKSETLNAVNALNITVQNLSTQIVGMQQNITDANAKITKLEKQNCDLRNKIDQLDNNCRKNNILVFGLSESTNGESPEAVFAEFVSSKLQVDLSPHALSNVYRVGKNVGSRPLFVQFSQYKYKNQVMKNVKNLKGSNISISDDLTPEARAKKKDILKCATEARNAGLNVKVRPGFLLVNDVKVDHESLLKPNWMQMIQKTDNTETNNERKRSRTESSSPLNPTKEPRQTYDASGAHSSRIQGNMMPPPQNTSGGKTRSRSSSQGKKAT
jgi:hypothetical protein